MAFSLFITQWLVPATPYLVLTALIAALIAICLFISLHFRLSRLTVGKSGSFEETVGMLSRDLKQMKVFRGELEQYLKLVEKRLQGSLSGVGMLRFNPFSGDGSGGNQSFAAAFLDEKHNGVVLSSLYARDRMAVYGKPIVSGLSTFELTKEEKEAIERAKKSIENHTAHR